MARRSRKRKKKLSLFGRLLTDILLIISLGTAGYSGYRLWQGLHEYHQSEAAYEDIRTTVQVVATPEPTPTPEAYVDPHTFPEVTIDYDALQQQNGDFAGWVYMPDSTIDLPIVQGSDNEFYLYHLFNGEYNKSGCVFLDTHCQKDFSDKVNVLYAHHMKNGTMFADIEKFKEQSWYDAHKVIQLTTKDICLEVDPVAGMIANGSTAYIRYDFADDADFMNYVQSFLDKSTFVSDVSITPEDSIVLFSTCSYDVYDGRYVLLGRVRQVR